MLPGRTVQVHLTRRCNLRCAHCYSDSGPQVAETLEPESLLRFLGHAREAGFDTLSLSGGEPFLYPGLDDLLARVRSDGWRVTAVSNGTLFGQPRVRRALERIDVVGVSLDGPRELHDRIRRKPGAYDRMLAGLEILREAGKPFALVHTLTRDGLEHLLGLIDLARREGAAALRLHPLEAVGEATRSLGGQGLDGPARATVYLAVAALLAEDDLDLRIELDLVNRELVPAPCSAFEELPLHETLSPLVVGADGTVMLYSYGVGPALRLGHLLRAEDPFAVARRHLPRVRRVLEETAARAHAEPWPFVDWFSLLGQASRRGAEKRPVVGSRLPVLPGQAAETPCASGV